MDNPPTVNTIQAGQAILDKWQLFDAATGQPISDPMSHHLPDGHAHTEKDGTTHKAEFQFKK